MRRRLLFALVPLLALAALAEGVGRLRDDPHAADTARLYEPGAVLVRAEGARRVTARDELHDQAWVLPKTGYRVAFVGDSTVWGQLPDAFGQALVVPGAAVEVLNFGIRGAASDRARIAAEAAVAQDLDLLVVYVGHNEVTEARLNPVSLRPFWQRRVASALLGSGVARLLGPVLDPLRAALAADPSALRDKGDAAPRPLAEAEWAPVAASYRRNLEAICTLADPARIVFVEPISSLVHPGEAPPDSPPIVRSAMESGIAAARLGDPTDALGWADRLRGYYPELGPPRALRGLALLGLGDRDGALVELREARRRDAQPTRATEAHWAIVREVAAGCGATAVRTEPAFLPDARYLGLDDALFMDRVHPTLPGNVLLAGIIAAAAPLPAGTAFEPARVTLTPPADEATRGWRLPGAPADPP
ncbi:MAG: hypothetical protein Q8P41_11565 [Pseudomonadota bacterium]|nr:hypothetical protein [Pseudomonadota bacterium]